MREELQTLAPRNSDGVLSLFIVWWEPALSHTRPTLTPSTFHLRRVQGFKVLHIWHRHTDPESNSSLLNSDLTVWILPPDPEMTGISYYEVIRGRRKQEFFRRWSSGDRKVASCCVKGTIRRTPKCTGVVRCTYGLCTLQSVQAPGSTLSHTDTHPQHQGSLKGQVCVLELWVATSLPPFKKVHGKPYFVFSRNGNTGRAGYKCRGK